MAATGCGLVLDTQPRDHRSDTGMGELDGGEQDGDVPGCMIDDECQNGNLCDGRETCVEGQCLGTDAILICEDSFACTDDSCDPQLGCVFTPVDDRCGNEGICFTDTGCSATRPCQEPTDCGTQNACVGLFQCLNNICQRAAPLSCPDNGCLVGGCFNGGCVYATHSSRCNNASAGRCAVSTCLATGECSVPEPDDSRCDDSIDCTTDTCVGEGQTGSFCTHLPDHAFCDDSVDCTYNFCAPDDPTADVVGGGCAMRLIDSICAEQGGFAGCVSPVCLPTGCDDGVVVHACGDGEICDIDTGECEVPQNCVGCLDLGSPCAPTTCGSNQNQCVLAPDPCATALPCTVGFCDTSGSVPTCAFRPNADCLPGISLPLPLPVLP